VAHQCDNHTQSFNPEKAIESTDGLDHTDKQRLGLESPHTSNLTARREENFHSSTIHLWNLEICG
jgi:hypothetical protein